jgi:hypothetical protein
MEPDALERELAGRKAPAKPAAKNADSGQAPAHTAETPAQ